MFRWTIIAVFFGTTLSHAIKDMDRMWQPIGAPVIPYEFEEGYPDDLMEIVEEAMTYWEERTCIQFRPAEEDDEDVIQFAIHEEICDSDIGVVGGVQQINLAIECHTISTITHELAHAFGVDHTQSRSDRRRFVKIDASNIEESREDDFEKLPERGVDGYYSYGVPYEYGSLMHYHHTNAAKDPTRPVIHARDKRYQHSMSAPRPTFYDVLLVNRMYKCKRRCEVKLKCKNFGVQHGSDCSKCFCPRGWTGRLCSKRPSDAIAVEVTEESANLPVEVEASEGEFLEKLYILTAPAGMKIMATVKELGGSEDDESCEQHGFEIISSKDTRRSGFRFCAGTEGATPIVSRSNIMLIWMYNELDDALWANIKIRSVW